MRNTKILVIPLVLMVVLSIAFQSGYSKPKIPTPSLTATITAPTDGLSVEENGNFILSGSILCSKADCGSVDSYVQYCSGEGCSNFVNVDGTTLQIMSGSQPQSANLDQDQSYNLNWLLTGDPGTYEVRIYADGSSTNPANSASRTVTIQGPPPPLGNETIDSEYQDPSIGYGSATGTYANTYYTDGVYEVLSEQKNGQGTRNPTDDTTELGWIYVFNDLGTRTDTIFCMYGHAYFTGSDSDTGFHVQWKSSGSWSTMFTVSSTGNSMYCADIPDDSSGTIYIRVIDNDQTAGNKEISSLYVDQAYIYFASDSNPPASVDVTLDATFYDSGDTAYVEADVLLADSNPMTTGTVTATFMNDYNYDDTYDSTHEISLSYDSQSQSWKGSWAPSTAGYYLVEVEATNGDGTEYGYEDFHLYPSSGVSTYMFDWSGDGTDEFVLENRHLIAVYNSGTTYYPLAMVMQKDTGISYTLSSLSDPDANGRMEPVTTSAGSLLFSDIASADNLQSATLTSQGSSGFGMEILVGSPSGYGEDDEYKATVWESQDSTWVNDYNISIMDRIAHDIVVADIDGDNAFETVISGGNRGAGFGEGTAHVMVFENNLGDIESVYNITFPYIGEDVFLVHDIDVGDLDNDGGDDLEILACGGPTGPIQVTIFKKIGSDWVAYFNITSGFKDSVGCNVVAVGDLDGDNKNEFAITEEWPGDTYGHLMVRVFDNQSSTWVNTANYSFPISALNWFFGMEIADVDQDGTKELIVQPAVGQTTGLKYTGSALVNIYTLSQGFGTSLLVGDVTNDGKLDIALPIPYYDKILIYENVLGGIVNTVNASAPGLDAIHGHNSMDIGDIDNDGNNEYIHVGQDAKLRIFRNNVQLEAIDLPYEDARGATIGDYDNDMTSSFRVDITMNSQDADYLVYKLSEFVDASNVYFPIAGVLDTVSDDQYRAGTNGGYITSLTQNIWTDFSLSGANTYVCTYDSQTGDVIGFANGMSSSGVSIDKLSVWNEAGSSEAMRIKYDLSSAGASDYAEFLFAFTRGSYTTIANQMMNISYGFYPASLYNY